jgi:hypothetical protein
MLAHSSKTCSELFFTPCSPLAAAFEFLTERGEHFPCNLADKGQWDKYEPWYATIKATTYGRLCLKPSKISSSYKKTTRPGMVGCAYNPSSWELIQDWPGKKHKTLSDKTNKK